MAFLKKVKQKVNNKWYLLWMVLLAALFSVVSTVRAQSDTEEIKEKYPYIWSVREGSPCKVVTEDEYFTTRRTYYFTRDGELFAVFSERKDTPMSYRPVVYSHFYALDDKMEVVGCQQYNYNWADGGRVDTVLVQSNNLALSSKERVRKPNMELGNITYHPKDCDAKGNWLKGGHLNAYKNTEMYTRKIFYYGEAPKVEKEVAAVLARRDTLITWCQENGWTSAERSRKERKDKHGFGWNFLVPLLLGAAFGLGPSLLLAHKTKLSNLTIFVINIALALYIGPMVASIVFIIGPYGSLWEGIFWFIAVCSYLFSMSMSLNKRCPKCGSYDCTLTGKMLEKETQTETAEYPDGTKEVLKRNTDYTTIDTMYCNNCGHTFMNRWFGKM